MNILIDGTGAILLQGANTNKGYPPNTVGYSVDGDKVSLHYIATLDTLGTFDMSSLSVNGIQITPENVNNQLKKLFREATGGGEPGGENWNQDVW